MISAHSVSVPQALTLRDLTDPAAGAHGIQCLVEDVEIALRNALRCACIRRPSRRSFEDGGAAGEVAACALASPPRDLLVSCPGIVFRARPDDAGLLDATHELAVLRVRSGRRLGAESVDAMAHTALSAVLPDRRHHLRDVDAKGTVDSVRLVVEAEDGAPVDVGECGVLSGAVLASVPGLDSTTTSVVLLRVWLDAVLMLRKGVDDPSLLRSEDPAIAGQMRELGRFRRAS